MIGITFWGKTELAAHSGKKTLLAANSGRKT
jgi:uncharacterized protein Veg